jgi:hypothetical protein
MVHSWLQSKPLVAQRVVGINPLMPDRGHLPDRVLAYELEAQCLAWLRARRPSRLHWLALDDRSWLILPFCLQLFLTDGTRACSLTSCLIWPTGWTRCVSDRA